MLVEGGSEGLRCERGVVWPACWPLPASSYAGLEGVVAGWGSTFSIGLGSNR